MIIVIDDKIVQIIQSQNKRDRMGWYVSFKDGLQWAENTEEARHCCAFDVKLLHLGELHSFNKRDKLEEKRHY